MPLSLCASVGRRVSCVCDMCVFPLSLCASEPLSRVPLSLSLPVWQTDIRLFLPHHCRVCRLSQGLANNPGMVPFYLDGRVALDAESSTACFAWMMQREPMPKDKVFISLSF